VLALTLRLVYAKVSSSNELKA